MTIETINNGESGKVVRDKINDNFGQSLNLDPTDGLQIGGAAPNAEQRAAVRAGIGLTPLALVDHGICPDSVADRVPAGFTCTGLTRATKGPYSGCWLVGDDGRLVQDDASPYEPKVHVVSPGWERILVSYAMPGNLTIQGVCIDDSSTNETMWVALGDGTVRRYHFYGAQAGNEITANRYTWTHPGVPNGLAYVKADNALWVSAASLRTIRKIACSGSASPRLLAEVILPVGADPDHLWYDDDTALLYYSQGGNTVDGSVWCYDTVSGITTEVYPSLSKFQAVEGIYIDKIAGFLWAVCDGGYHPAASPALNGWRKYRL